MAGALARAAAAGLRAVGAAPVCAVLAACGPPAGDAAIGTAVVPAPRVSAEGTGGTYVGTAVTTRAGATVLRFSGMRYAEPPVGEARWRAPRPARPAGETDATGWPPACMQDEGNVAWYAGVAASFGITGAFAMSMPPVDEDCLFLNLWTPDTPDTSDTGARLPVMVWIHGGGNVNGWSHEPNYRGAELAARGVVVVSIQYRLGVFGFLAHPALGREQAHGSSGNYGVLDQVEALRWLRHHVAAFGGDPGNVTVFGESAGAGDIGYLLFAPQARGLFHRAISQSGGWPADRRKALAEAEAEGERFLSGAGIGSIDELRSVPANRLLVLAAEHFRRGSDDPSVDGWLLPAAAPELLAEGRFATVPVMFGTNADEDQGLVDPEAMTEAAWQAAFAGLPNPGAARARLAEFSVAERLAALGAGQFHCPTLRFADAVAAAGVATYVYRFARTRPGGHGVGAYHGAEIPYVFDTHDPWLPTDAVDRVLTGRMMDYWLNFARTGDPNGSGLPTWPAWQAGGEALVLDGTVQAQPLDRSLCDWL